MKKIKLIRIWYGVIVIILVALLYEHTTKLEFASFVFWVRLVFLLVALLLTFYVIGDVMGPERAAKRVEKILSKEIRRKSHQIKRLKEEKEMFMRTALKRAGEDVEIKGKKD